MSVYLSLIILTVASERSYASRSMMLLLQLCLDFTLHLTPSSLQWFWLPRCDLSSSENCRSLTWGPSQEYPWQCSCPGRLPLAPGITPHSHYSYSHGRALTAVVVVTGCRCGRCCGRSLGSSQWAPDSRDLTLTSVTSPEWAPSSAPCDSYVGLLMAVMLASPGVTLARWSLLTLTMGRARDYEAECEGN